MDSKKARDNYDKLSSDLRDELDDIGTLHGHYGTAVVLSHETSEACGHHEDEGSGSSPEQCEERRRVWGILMNVATKLDESLEVYADHEDWGKWQVDTICPMD